MSMTMALLDELVQEEDLDPEVMGQTNSTFKNLPELEKIRRLIQMDLLEESHLLRKMSDRYNLPLLSTTLDEVKITKTFLCQSNFMNAPAFYRCVWDQSVPDCCQFSQTS